MPPDNYLLVHEAHCGPLNDGVCKYGELDCPVSQYYQEPEELEVFLLTGQYLRDGYRCISNKYRIIARIDRDDWLQVMATKMHCSVADYYNMDGSGVADHWKDHYVRVHSTDQISDVPYEVYMRIKKGANK